MNPHDVSFTHSDILAKHLATQDLTCIKHSTPLSKQSSQVSLTCGHLATQSNSPFVSTYVLGYIQTGGNKPIQTELVFDICVIRQIVTSEWPFRGDLMPIYDWAWTWNKIWCIMGKDMQKKGLWIANPSPETEKLSTQALLLETRQWITALEQANSGSPWLFFRVSHPSFDLVFE